ncbi:hypothetical protein [Nitratifractor salsuginis]|uniref:Uncharacterized protein n=1 Tax=Nitratifractor salsuginis (strain DSM 16511 / JCM 12458 / E9I37-1) TaxID=749222 RepID=E6WY40_NITSE|nr:hypothetical protein [Nitratifractor salsuginis]ADV46414.1 hypothetical protein Nitsa_1161 [Nitratifractor salsuginis DSM 16511]
MTVDTALQTMQKIIDNTLEEYNQSPDSKDDQGNRIPHPLDIVDQDDELFALDISLKEVALKAAPVSLLETSGSTAPELRRVSTDYYIRVPAEPQTGQNLDIDDGLSYAVVYRALGKLWREYSEYEQESEAIVSTYIQAYRTYMDALIAGTVQSDAEAYIRFSADGSEWHDSYTPGDIYISFRKIDTDSWTPAIRFVGQDGHDGEDGQPCSDTQFVALQDTPSGYDGMAGKVVAVKSSEDGVEFIDAPSGGGASKFTDLQDTPSALTADKWLKVNAAGDAIELTDAPSGGGAVTQFGDKVFYSEDSGDVELDAETYNSFYLYPSDNTTYSFKKFDDDNDTSTDQVSGWFGTTYTLVIVSIGNVAVSFDTNEQFYGDVSVEPGSNSNGTNISATVLDLYYDGAGWIVKNRVVITDYNA